MFSKIKEFFKKLLERIFHRREKVVEEPKTKGLDPEVFKKVAEAVRKLTEGLKGLRIRYNKRGTRIIHRSLVRNKREPVDPSKHLGSNNHNKKSSKKRRKMAHTSNNINRKRIKNWPH